MMFVRSAALLVLSAIAVSAKSDMTALGAECPEVSPVSAAGEGGSCAGMNQACEYTEFNGAPACPSGTVFQCRCVSGGDPFICSCRGDGKEAEEVDVEEVEMEEPEGTSGAFAASVASSLMLSGAIATFAVGV
mmetsp:Transcript_18062/g.41629  ORF Transcript_18062/g.41629 Transcript_18062/m.41629 type:complete len:133 (-) Transcript_18062:156-554(-)